MLRILLEKRKTWQHSSGILGVLILQQMSDLVLRGPGRRDPRIASICTKLWKRMAFVDMLVWSRRFQYLVVSRCSHRVKRPWVFREISTFPRMTDRKPSRSNGTRIISLPGAQTRSSFTAQVCQRSILPCPGGANNRTYNVLPIPSKPTLLESFPEWLALEPSPDARITSRYAPNIAWFQRRFNPLRSVG